MILLCPPEKSTQFHCPLDPKKIRAEGSMHKDTTCQGSDRQDFYRHENKKKKTKKEKNEMLPWSIYWVACGTCYRKSEGTELCGIEIQHSSLRRITNKREARNIGFWADMLIIFKFPHNFFSPQVCPLSIWMLCNTKIHWSQALSGGVSVRMGDQNNKPPVKHKHLTENTINANKCEQYRFC